MDWIGLLIAIFLFVVYYAFARKVSGEDTFPFEEPIGTDGVPIAEFDYELAEKVKGEKHLKRLNLMSAKITDAGLIQSLKGLSKLEELILWECREITDAGLVHLKGLANLKELNLCQTETTDAGVKDLQKVLPDCWIKYIPSGQKSPFTVKGLLAEEKKKTTDEEVPF